MPNRFSHGTSLGFPGRDTMPSGISLNHGLFRQETSHSAHLPVHLNLRRLVEASIG